MELKNPELKKAIIIEGIIAIISLIITINISISCGIILFFAMLVIICVGYIPNVIRYRRIEEINDKMNKVLHGDYSISFDEYTEGELAILTNEISKMTMTLKEQNEKLYMEKEYLADSIADISHQLRTPLTSMSVITSILNKESINETKRRELNQELIELINKMEWHINTLLKISKLDSKTARFVNEPISVDKLIKKAIEPFEIQMELRQQTLNITRDNTAEFKGDFNWIIEAIGNIIKNCLEHIDYETGILDISYETNAVFTQINISDNGKGIEKEDRDNIFLRFYRGKNSSESGYGIGLALSKSIINSQNGTIKVLDNKPKGTRFEIRFYKVTV